MNGCHACEHAAAIAAREFENMAWEEIPCATCKIMAGADLPKQLEEWRESLSVCEEFPEEEPEEVLPVAVMREAMVGFLSLKPELRDVVAWRYAGMKYDDIGEAQGVSGRCAEGRHRRAMALWPVLRAMFPEKCAKQERRKDNDDTRD